MNNTLNNTKNDDGNNQNIKRCGKIKKFDKELHEKYDIPARDKVKELLGDYICDNPDTYGEDMILNIPESNYKYLELQVCASWTENRFPFPKPYIYERKMKFSNKCLFLLFNKNLTKGLLFSRDTIVGKPKRFKKYSREFIYDIQWSKVIQVSMDDFDKDTILLYN